MANKRHTHKFLPITLKGKAVNWYSKQEVELTGYKCECGKEIIGEIKFD